MSDDERLWALVRDLRKRVAELEALEYKFDADNADTVDGYHAATSGADGHVIATDGNGVATITGGGAAATLMLVRNNVSIAAADQLGYIPFCGVDELTENIGCSLVAVAVADWTALSCPAYLRVRAVPSGSTGSQPIADFAATGVVLNEPGNADQDLRVETDTEANMVFVDGGTDEVYLGGTTNGVKIAKGGELSLIGTATVYDDVFMPINIAGLPGANTPSVAALTTNTSALTFAINDYANPATAELHHSYAEGTDLDVHLHLITNGSDAADTKVRYIVYYTIGDMGEGMSVESSMTAEKTITGGTADRTHLYLDMGNISGAGYKIGALIHMRVKRLDNSDHPLHATYAEPTADPFVAMLGIHYQIDTMGSKTETAK